MIIDVDRPEFARAMRTIAPVRRHRRPAHIELTARRRVVAITATSATGHLTIRRVLADAKVVRSGTAIMPTTLLSRARAGTVTITAGDIEGYHYVEADGIRWSTPTPGDDPELALPSGADEFALVDGELDEINTHIAGYASDDDSRPILTTVLLERNKRHRRWVATDSYRLSTLDRPGRYPAKSILIPAFALKAARGPGEAVVRIAGDVVQIACGPTTVTTRLTAGTFPDYGVFFKPEPKAFVARLPRADVLEACAKAKRLNRALGPWEAIPIRLTDIGPAGATWNVSCSAGSATGSIGKPDPSSDVNVAFSSTFLAAPFAHSGDELELAIVDAVKPVHLTDPDNPRWRSLLMPVRVA